MRPTKYTPRCSIRATPRTPRRRRRRTRRTRRRSARHPHPPYTLYGPLYIVSLPDGRDTRSRGSRRWTPWGCAPSSRAAASTARSSGSGPPRRCGRKGPYYTVAHTTPHTTLHLNKNREALRQRKSLTPGAAEAFAALNPAAAAADLREAALIEGSSPGAVAADPLGSAAYAAPQVRAARLP
jgi:hypothetical protein